MRTSETREIDGLKVTAQQMPVKRATKLLYKLARAGVPAALKAVGESDMSAGLTLAKLDLSNLGEAAAMLFDKFSDADLDHCTNELLESAVVEDSTGKTLPALKALDVTITNPFTLGKILVFALEVNYGNFSAAFLAAAGTLGLKAPQSKA